MNKKLLCAAMLGGLAFAGAASAQEFDDRWYLTGSAGMNIQDNKRDSRDAPFLALGVGKFLNPNWSLDAELNYQKPKADRNQDLNWSQYGISLDARYHFLAEGRNWNPYVLMGLGYQRAEEEFDPSNPLLPARFTRNGAPSVQKDGHVAGKLGFGAQGDVGRVKIRTELAYRIDAHDDSVGAFLSDDVPRDDGADWFGDVLASVGVVVPLGPEPMVPVAPAPPPPPAPPVQEAPVPVTIDLRGVNFDFDKSTLRADSLAILNEALEILRRYPEVRVEVAGHTDLCGSDAYNQSLSERRARAVYDYMTSNGIDSSRLAGPIGYGESRPLEQTEQTQPGCRNERNRRTELNVQN
ncbi:OmpA family protein [Lysobacter ciconiae]|uniref:OmpA family protein n=1 Tax=Novilysobacter ciconiae TaxID=2781022 RepID=A0A7S6UGU0_9GAMM|nr:MULTISPECIES: OmpA family protein [Lysobacter]QOW19980.1 OmpA family protein [Lysobacter ciconiae]QOY63201.1 OmpA family protein [Lysobacter sp. H21R4]